MRVEQLLKYVNHDFMSVEITRDCESICSFEMTNKLYTELVSNRVSDENILEILDCIVDNIYTSNIYAEDTICIEVY